MCYELNSEQRLARNKEKKRKKNSSLFDSQVNDKQVKNTAQRNIPHLLKCTWRNVKI